MRFKIGDVVVKLGHEYADSDEIPQGTRGVIQEIARNTWHDQPYRVEWELPDTRDEPTLFWWINGDCLDLYEQISTNERIIRKIKYLNEKFNQSRAVSAQVGHAQQGTSS